MDVERHEEHHVTERVDSEADTPPAADPATVVAPAAAAVALAEATAAAAELDAAERVRHIDEGMDEWRTTTQNQMVELGTGLAQTSEAVALLHSREDERHKRDEELLARLALLESRLPIPDNSNEAEAAEAETENPNLAGAEAGANLGPIAAEVSGGASLEGISEPNPSPDARPARRKHRWI